MATEQRAYEVMQREGSLELRRYPAYLTAKVTVDATAHDEATSKGFNALAGYIFGNNTASGSIPMTSPVTASRPASEKIAMTVPVTSEHARNEELQSASPLCTISCAGEYVVRFTMPSRYGSVQELPTPNDSRVILEEEPEHLAVAVGFGGRLDEAAIAAAVEQIEEWVEREGHTAIGEPEAAQYDAPWKPGFIRRNEVLIPVASE